MRPLVTLGVPVYNGANYLRDALESLLGQSFGDFELMISDNASTDNTPLICSDFAARDSRIKYVRQHENRGAAFNFNLLARSARSKYFKWAAHDDICKPAYLESCLNALESAPKDVILAHTRAETIDKNGNVMGPLVTFGVESEKSSDRFDYLIRHVPPCTSVFGLIRTDVLQSTELLGGYYAADIALLAELSLRGKFAIVDKPLFLRRKHAESSLHIDPTPRGIARWFDPDNENRLIMPSVKLLLGLVQAVKSAQLSRSEKKACYQSLTRYWIPHKKKSLVKDITLPVRYPVAQVIQKSSTVLRGKRIQ